MSVVQTPLSVPPGAVIAGRYAVEYTLGRGGMGSVYAVRDLATGRSVALKCLKRGVTVRDGAERALFQREFHTLAHLSHPCVINVYDYGVDQGRPFYTMELLDGSDLRELAPVPWQQAGRWLRDVASSLAVLHSRRLLHRDLSPRNVRCTGDGRAKLIDFGTMSPMGIARDIAGTAPYIAPEAMHGQALDARTDLYALGALGYWMLTGCNAYPARELHELGAVWSRSVVPLSVMPIEVPEALDALIMELLSLDMHGRPHHAAEVIDRLSAIVAVESLEQREVASAFLTSPTLVGHEERIASFHKRLVRASRGRGSSVLIRGPGGSGRSRLLQALVLEAKLCGLQVLVADAEQGPQRELRLVRDLLQRLIESAPALALEAFAPHAAVLARMFPELHGKLPDPPEPLSWPDPRDRMATFIEAIHAWLLAASQKRALLIAIDDADHADEASLACLAQLAGDARLERLVVVATLEHEAPQPALELLSAESAHIDLAPLDAGQSRELLHSVFGHAPHLRTVADWVFGLALGNPRTTLELAQYLVDHGIARYDRGSWMLPESLRDQALPASIEQAVQDQLAALGIPARALAEALALVTEHGPLELDELIQFAGADTAEETHRGLGELIAANLVVTLGSIHCLRQRSLVRTLTQGMLEERRQWLHLRLAALYRARLSAGRDPRPGEEQVIDDSARLLSAYHRQVGKELTGCWELLDGLDPASDVAFGRTAEAIAMYEACLVHGDAVSLSPARMFPLRKRLLRLSSTADPSLIKHAEPTLAQLCRDSGWIFLDDFRAEPDALQRIRQCLRMARQCYEQTDPSRRGLEPAEACYELGSCALILTQTFVVRNDVEALRRLPALLAPFAPHSPVFEFLHELSRHALLGLLGKDGMLAQTSALARLELPLSGLDPLAQQAIRCVFTYWVGMDEAALGRDAALVRAGALEQQPLYAALGAQIRAIYHLFQGDEVEAESWQRRHELLGLQNASVEITAARGVSYEALGYYLCGSVLGVRRCLAMVEKLAGRFPGWESELHTLQGLYELLRGQPEKALVSLQQCDAPARVQALLELGEADAARNAAEGAFVDEKPVRDHPLHAMRMHAARALAWSAAGESEAAALMLEVELQRAESLGIAGLLLGVMYEARARIAIGLDDHAAFQSSWRRLGTLAGRSASRLRARYEQLGVTARRESISVPTLSGAASSGSAVNVDLDALRDVSLSHAERAQHALLLLGRRAKSSRAFLYGLQSSGLRLAAQLGTEPAPDGLDDLLGFYLNAELDSGQGGSSGAAGPFAAAPVDMVAWINDGHHLYYPVLLSCRCDAGRLVAGVAALALPRQQEPELPAEWVEAISRALLEAGAVAGVAAAQ